LLVRARYIWSRSTVAQRRGYFLAGVGLGTGHALDAMASDANILLVTANEAVLNEDQETAIKCITALAERVSEVAPFKPDALPGNWKEILRAWLLGLPLANLVTGNEDECLQFVEGALVYRLPWAMESIRVRGIANGDVVGVFGMPLEAFPLGLAVSAVETGTLNRPAAILIQSGFSSRLAAIKAVADSHATFKDSTDFRIWLASDTVRVLESQGNWPTPETSALWRSFSQSCKPQSSSVWKEQHFWAPVVWGPEVTPLAKLPVRVVAESGTGVAKMLSAGSEHLGAIAAPVNPNRKGLLRATVMDDPGRVLLSYLGPDDLWQSAAQAGVM
jgi:hypothetical protein